MNIIILPEYLLRLLKSLQLQPSGLMLGEVLQLLLPPQQSSAGTLGTETGKSPAASPEQSPAATLKALAIGRTDV